MAPPRKGTPEYDAYLEKQKERRKKSRAKKRAVALKIKAQPLIQAALRTHRAQFREDLGTAVLQKCAAIRRANTAERRTDALLNTNRDLTEQLTMNKDVVKDLIFQNKKLKEDLEKAKKELKEKQQQLRGWTTWWAWVLAKSKPGFVAHLRRLGRSPPKRAGDRSWGGGQ